MPKGSKFDPNSAFNSIISNKGMEENKTEKSKNQGKLLRSYYLERDLFKDIRTKAIEEDVTMTDIVNKAIRIGLDNWDK